MKTNVKAAQAPNTVTYEGTPAKRLTDMQALQRAMASCLLWEDQFYEDGELIADRIKRLTLSIDPTQAAEIAVQARNQYKLRHAPLWVARWLASGTKAQKAVVANLLSRIIQRPDELTEFLALYWKDGKTPLAASVKRGLATAFTKFNAYSLAKYNRDDAIKLRDVLFMVHAKPKDAEQAATWRQLAEGTLPVSDTWEVALSSGADKCATWTRLLSEGKLGALALLRNLRNMQSAKVPDTLICEALSTVNVERVLPFRFIAAARYAPHLEPDLERAMFRCLTDAPKLSGRTAIVVDTSPSMWMAKVSAKSEMDRFDAAAALAILCREVCESVRVYAFNERAHEVPSRRGFALRDALAQTKGQASCGGLAVQMANEHGYDRIIVLTDGEWHYMDQAQVPSSFSYQGRNFPVSPSAQWRLNGGYTAGPAHQVSPAPLGDKAYLINVAANRNAIGSGKWTMLDGWSEAIVDYIQASEAILP